MNGHLINLLTLMKGQPLAYNKDNQEDKEPLFDAGDTLQAAYARLLIWFLRLNLIAEAMREAALRGFATTTDLTDYLVKTRHGI